MTAPDVLDHARQRLREVHAPAEAMEAYLTQPVSEP